MTGIPFSQLPQMDPAVVEPRSSAINRAIEWLVRDPSQPAANQVQRATTESAEMLVSLGLMRSGANEPDADDAPDHGRAFYLQTGSPAHLWWWDGAAWTKAGAAAPPRVLKFASLYGDTAALPNAAFQAFSLDQSNNYVAIAADSALDNVAAFVFGGKQAAFGTAPSDPVVSLDSVDTGPLIGDRIANGSHLVMCLKRGNDTAFFRLVEFTALESGSNGGFRATVGARSLPSGFTIDNLDYDIVLGDWLRFTDDIVDADAKLALLDASNLTAAFRSNVRGPWEPYEVTTNQRRLANGASVTADNRWQVNGVPALGGAAVGIVWQLDAANYAEVLRHWSEHRRIVFPTGTLLITGSVNELGSRKLQATVQLVRGALPAVGVDTKPTIRGVPTWSDVREDVRMDGSADDGSLVTEKAVADAIAGDERITDFIESLYDGWTSLNNATYSAPADIVAKLPVDVSSDANATVPTANQRVILRPNNTTWTEGPAGIVWGLDFLQGGTRWVFGITANGADQKLYRRDGANWVDEDIWTEGIPAALYGYWAEVLDGDIVMRIDDGAGADAWDLPGATGDPFLYRKSGRDIAAISPNYGGGNLVNYAWNRFALLDRGELAKPPTEGNHYTAARTLAAGDLGKWISAYLTSNFGFTLAGSLGAVGDRMILAARSQGNFGFNVICSDGEIEIWDARYGKTTLNSAGSHELLGTGGNRAIVYTAEKTGAAKWTIREGVWQ